MNLEELKHIHANIDSQMGPVDGVSQAEFDESMEMLHRAEMATLQENSDEDIHFNSEKYVPCLTNLRVTAFIHKGDIAKGLIGRPPVWFYGMPFCLLRCRCVTDTEALLVSGISVKYLNTADLLWTATVDVVYDFVECVVEFNNQFEDFHSTFIIVDPLTTHTRIKGAFNSRFEAKSYPHYVMQIGDNPISPYTDEENEAASMEALRGNADNMCISEDDD